MHEPDDIAETPNPYEAVEIAQLASQGKEPTKPKPPRMWTVWVVFILSFAAALVLSALATIPFILPDVLANPGKPPAEDELMAKLSTPFAFFATAFPAQLAIMFAALFAATLSPIPIRERLGFTDSGLKGMEILAVGLGVIVPGAIGMGLAYLLTFLVEPDTSADLLWKNMGPIAAIPFVLFIALMPGFGEEMLFRGYMQRRLLKRWTPVLAIFVTSLLFAIVHVMPHAIVFAFPVGLWLGYVAWKTNSIWPTILGHALLNGIWNIINISTNLFGWSDVVYAIVLTAVLLVGIAAFVWSWSLLRRDPDSEYGNVASSTNP